MIELTFSFQDGSRSQNSGETDRDSVLEQGHLDNVTERDFDTDLDSPNVRDLLHSGQQGTDYEGTNVNWNTLLTDGSGDDEAGTNNDEPNDTESCVLPALQNATLSHSAEHATHTE